MNVVCVRDFVIGLISKAIRQAEHEFMVLQKLKMSIHLADPIITD